MGSRIRPRKEAPAGTAMGVGHKPFPAHQPLCESTGPMSICLRSVVAQRPCPPPLLAPALLMLRANAALVDSILALERRATQNGTDQTTAAMAHTIGVLPRPR